MTKATPRVFIARHGETEWSLSGQHTGVSDIPLTANGEKRVRATGRALVGPDRLIVPTRLAAVLVSPRQRAQRTLQLMFEEGVNGGKEAPIKDLLCRNAPDVTLETRQDIREWDYGDYEGITTQQIADKRKAQGNDKKFVIWEEGCPNGESPEDVTRRLDALIADIRERFHRPAFEHLNDPGTNEADCPNGDVLVVAHGHILRSFAARWTGRDIRTNPNFLLDAGGIGVLSYDHKSIKEPAILLGGAFVVDA